MGKFSEEYKGVTITYDIANNSWTFELNGREKSSGSLLDARATVDNAPKKSKADFTPFEAWVIQYSGLPHEATVTSVAKVLDYLKRPHVWVKSAEGRSKEACSNVCPKSPLNDDLMHKVLGLHDQVKSLVSQRDKLIESMVRMEFPKEEE